MNKSKSSPPEIAFEGEIDGRKIIAPKGKVIATFKPTKNFSAPEFATEYQKDGQYFLREGNQKLEAVLLIWQAEGLVTVQGVA
jgi:hypothetical protein